jgi:hypothetical protein
MSEGRVTYLPETVMTPYRSGFGVIGEGGADISPTHVALETGSYINSVKGLIYQTGKNRLS